MSNIFGYSNTQPNDWGKLDKYTTTIIKSIPDPNGGNAIELPSAVPSPFARIDLVRTAFKNIVFAKDTLKAKKYNEQVDASKDDEKLVSDCLDLAELLFNIDNQEIKSNLQIIPWDKKSELAKLRSKDGKTESGARKHKNLADTLEMYFRQDAKSYNFDDLDRLFLLKYKQEIIGCTSPVTMFFSSANDLSIAKVQPSNKYTLFDDKYEPLYERNEDFIKYIYHLFKAEPTLNTKFKVFAEYLEVNLEIIKKDSNKLSLYNEIVKQTPDTFHGLYEKIQLTNNNDNVEVLGISLYKKKSSDVLAAAKKSSFRILSSKFEGDYNLVPLVLQRGYRKKIIYIDGEWDVANDRNVPFVNPETNLENRVLPGVGIKYPYLTVGDFLEPYLIKTSYPINNERFFDGNLQSEDNQQLNGYLLPLTQLFFRYFDTADLIQNKIGKPSIRMQQLKTENAIRVLLSIPIVGGEPIEFERKYLLPKNDSYLPLPSADLNDGIIEENGFVFGLFPCVKFNDGEKANYRTVLIEPENSTKNLDIQFYSEKEPNKISIIGSSKRGKGTSYVSNYSILESNFDYIQISINGIERGIIIPQFITKKSSDDYTFAVDFGTTNTHIEYAINGTNETAFNISKDDIQLTTFHSESASLTAQKQILNTDIIPQTIGIDAAEYKFPIRTALSESQEINYHKAYSLVDANIPFTYGKNNKLTYNKVPVTNLKWSTDHENKIQMELYIENLLLLLRNKVLLNGGNLNNTKVVWFYPASMNQGRYNQLSGVWIEKFEKYISVNNLNLISLCESEAPYKYFSASGTARRNVASIDIGGGTTDIVVVLEKDELKLLTSFRFAANSIFGDGYLNTALGNGLINNFIEDIEKSLEAKDLIGKYGTILKDIRSKDNASDIISFFFSLKDHGIDYNKMLMNDERYKVIFIIFYTSIIYHLAQIMKSEKLQKPRYITFSGTGSKVIQILTPMNELLERFTKLIFENIYPDKYHNDGLSIIQNPINPKEVTCKGGLTILKNKRPFTDSEDIESARKTLIGTDVITFATKETTYNSITETDIDKVVEEAKTFINFVFSLDNLFSFEKFSADTATLQRAKELCLKDIKDNVKEGFENRKKEENNEKPISETMFFYPIIGMLNTLAREL